MLLVVLIYVSDAYIRDRNVYILDLSLFYHCGCVAIFVNSK